MLAESLTAIAEALLTPLLTGAVRRVRGDPTVRAMAAALAEAITEASDEVAPDAEASRAVAELLQDWPREADPGAAVRTPDQSGDASRILTSAVAQWVRAVNRRIGLPLDGRPGRTSLELHGVDVDSLIRALDRQLRRAIAARAAAGAELQVVHDRLVDARRHEENSSAHATTHELLREVAQRAHPAPESAYLQLVREIAPPELADRDAELAALAEFCTVPDGDSYRYYRAGAWAGKSALLATFALDPPPGVRIVPFFITARFGGHNDRAAFATVVMEQLAEILGQPTPVHDNELTRYAKLTRMLDDAARACAERGERLVLLVDGLDEDRGVTGGADAYSIAAVLPARPAAGMRVLVAGRPEPPIPFDVPDRHPLRDDGAARSLADSPHARAARDTMTRELLQLARSEDQVERDIVGFVCVAGSGLRCRELAELIGVPDQIVADHLTAVVGRSFLRIGRDSAAEAAYVLAHQELQVMATQRLGTALADYRDRVHAWADRYRERGWPDGTPAYLLRDYGGLLRATEDLDRMVALGTDSARHELMLDITGGAALTLREIIATQEMLLDRAEPDVLAMARLAIHRDELARRGADLPAQLPALWARLGNARRGELLALRITEPLRYQEAMRALAHELSAHGDEVQADRLHAQAVLEPTRGQLSGEERLASIASALVGSGEYDRATQVARSIEAPRLRGKALRAVASELLRAGERQRALDVIDGIADPAAHVDALCTAAGMVAHTGDREHARHLLSLAEAHAGAIEDDYASADAFLSVVSELVELGELEHAARVASSIEHPRRRNHALARVVQARKSVGDLHRAYELARSIEHGRRRADLLAEIAVEWAVSGEHERVPDIVASIDEPALRLRALVDVAENVAKRGGTSAAHELLDRALAATRTDVDPAAATQVLAAVVPVLTALGEHGRAEELARAIDEPTARRAALTALASALAANGDHGGAERVANAIDDAQARARALTGVAWVMVNSGDLERAAHFALLTEETAKHITGLSERSDVVAGVAAVLARAGEVTDALRLVDSIRSARRQSALLGSVVSALADGGDHVRAEQIAGSISNPGRRDDALCSVVAALSATGEHAEAERVAASIGDATDRGRALAGVASALAAVGSHGRAERVARSIRARAMRAQALVDVARVLVDVGVPEQAVRLLVDAERVASDAGSASTALLVQLLVVVGEHERAEAVASDIESSAERDAAFVDLARAAAMTGGSRRIEQLAQEVTDEQAKTSMLGLLAGQLAREGSFDRAEGVLESIGDLDARSSESTFVARVMAGAGAVDRALDLAARAQRLTGRRTGWFRREPLLSAVAVAFLAAGAPERAAEVVGELHRLAGRLPDRYSRCIALAGTAAVATRIDDRAAAAQLLDEAYASLLDEGGMPPAEEGTLRAQASALTALATGLAAIGDHRRAETVTLLVPDATDRAQGLLSVASALLHAGANEQAAAMVARVEAMTPMLRPVEQYSVFSGAADVAAALGDHGWAERLARSIESPSQQAASLAELARHVGQRDATRLLARAFALGPWTRAVEVLAEVDREAAATLLVEYLAAIRHSAA